MISNNWIPFIQPQETFRITQRLVCITLRRLTHTIRLISLYYPTNPTPAERGSIDTQIKNIIAQFTIGDRIIMAGDMNTTLNPSIDRLTLNIQTNMETRPTQMAPSNPIFRHLTNKYDSRSLVDIWRTFNPTDNIYTHQVENGPAGKLSKSRIDFFLISRNLISSVTTTQIINSSCILDEFDHDIISLTVTLPITRLESMYNNAYKSSHYKINYDSINEDAAKQFNEGLEKDRKLIKQLDHFNEETNVDKEKLQNLYNILKEAIHRQAKNHLPITEYNKTSNTTNTKYKSQPRFKLLHSYIKIYNQSNRK